MSNVNKVAIVASKAMAAREAATELKAKWGDFTPDQADLIVVLGGDGSMLNAMHQHGHLNKPFYGMRLGKVGFLLNDFHIDDLLVRIDQAEIVHLLSIQMQAIDIHGRSHTHLAINEVALWRQSNQAAHLRIWVNGVIRMQELVADGILLATPAGSTAYNLSVQGPIIPLGTDALALTPISPFRPRRWRGAILPTDADVKVEVINPDRRPVSATADSQEVRDVVTVEMSLSDQRQHQLLFDPDHSLSERILNEQFQ